MKAKKKIFIGLFFILILGIIFIVLKMRNSSDPGELINTVRLERTDLETHIKGTGKIQSNNKRDIMSQVDAKIIKLAVEEGDAVKTGDILMTLDDSDIQYKIRDAELRLSIEEENLNKLGKDSKLDLELALSNAKILYEDGKNTYDRNLVLYESGAINKVDLDSSKDKMDQVKNDLLLAEDRLKNSNLENEKNMQIQRIELIKIEIDKLRKDLGDYTIKSPINGTIVKMNIDESGRVEPRNILISIQDMEDLQIAMDLNEYNSSKVKLGDRASISGDSLEGREYSGQVAKIGSIAKAGENGSSSIEVMVSIEGIDPNLKPGMSAKVDILTEKKEAVFSLPYEAVLTKEDGGKWVYKKSESGIEEIPVTLGISSDFSTEVVGDGLEEGLEIVLDPNLDMLSKSPEEE